MYQSKIRQQLADDFGIPFDQIKSTEVLTQDEIDRLLTAINAGDDEEDPQDVSRINKPKPYINDLSFTAMAEVNKTMADEMIENFKETFNVMDRKLTEQTRHIQDLTDAVKILQKEVQFIRAQRGDDLLF